jgi:hypothetical protein
MFKKDSSRHCAGVMFTSSDGGQARAHARGNWDGQHKKSLDKTSRLFR